MQDNLVNSSRRVLRSVNNCNKITNLFKNQKQEFLCENVQFIPKHILKKLSSKQEIICHDVIQAIFTPNKPSVDIFTMRTATKIQQNYKNSINEFELKNLTGQSLPLSEGNLSCLSDENRLKIKSFTSLVNELNEQNINKQLPTGKSIN